IHYIVTYSSLFYFFFYCAVVHLDLHSFPTRRSSDLRSCRKPHDFEVRGRKPLKHAACELEVPAAPPEDDVADVATEPQLLHHRGSEEHTSELQSRGHLVCRLLLEKKNMESKRVRPRV